MNSIRLNEILVAQVMGGFFHTEYYKHKFSIYEACEEIQDFLNREKNINDVSKISKYYIYNINDEDKNELKTQKTVQLRLNGKEDKIIINIKHDGITFTLSTLQNQGNLFGKDSYLYSIASFIDKFMKYRKSIKGLAAGVNPKFAIPFTKYIASEYLIKKFFKKEIQFIPLKTIKNAKFYLNTKDEKMEQEIEVKATKNTIVTSFDIQSDSEDIIQSYSSFLKKASDYYDNMCNSILQNLINLEYIDHQLLLKNVSLKSVE